MYCAKSPAFPHCGHHQLAILLGSLHLLCILHFMHLLRPIQSVSPSFLICSNQFHHHYMSCLFCFLQLCGPLSLLLWLAFFLLKACSECRVLGCPAEGPAVTGWSVDKLGVAGWLTEESRVSGLQTEEGSGVLVRLIERLGVSSLLPEGFGVSVLFIKGPGLSCRLVEGPRDSCWQVEEQGTTVSSSSVPKMFPLV